MFKYFLVARSFFIILECNLNSTWYHSSRFSEHHVCVHKVEKEVRDLEFLYTSDAMELAGWKEIYGI